VATVPRWVLAVVGVVVLVAAVDVGLVLVARSGAGDATPESTGTVAVIDPTNVRVVAHVDVGAQPTLVATGFGGVWVLNKGEGTVTHIDAQSHHVVSTLEPNAVANGLTVGAGGVWFVGRTRELPSAPIEEAKLERIDPATGVVDRTFDTSTGASVVAATNGALWSTGYLGGHVRGAARSDATTGELQRLNLTIYGDLIAAAEDSVYYVGSLGSRVARVSTRTGEEINQMTLVTDAFLAAGHVPANPTGAVFGGGSLWISESDGSILRIDAKLGGIAATIPACRNALAVAYGADAVWAACGNGTVARIDPSTDHVSAIVPVGRLPRGIAAGEGGVWVTLN
jgi:YVTN family beta-propeller protein